MATLLISYGVAEGLLTAFYLRGDIEPESIWIHAIKGRDSAVEFDPVLGYRLGSDPTRMMIIGSDGTVEAKGVFRGNNLGAPDNDDFVPERGSDNRQRFVVLGDSFTSGLYMERSWPDVAETFSQEQGTPVDLLNFSIDGGGLANWHQVLTRVIVAGDYEVDGAIFAVFGTDLSRPFTFWDQVVPGNNRSMLLGRLPDFDTGRYVEAEQQRVFGRDRLQPLETWQVVSPRVFDQYLAGPSRVPSGFTWPRSAVPSSMVFSNGPTIPGCCSRACNIFPTQSCSSRIVDSSSHRSTRGYRKNSSPRWWFISPTAKSCCLAPASRQRQRNFISRRWVNSGKPRRLPG